MNKPMERPQAAAAADAAEIERRLRIDLAAAYRLAAHYGMDDLIYTHFSARLPDGSGDFLLNPYGLMFDEITASSLIRVTPAGDVVGETEFELNVFGYKIHAPFYAARPEIGAVLHSHTQAGMALSAMECGLLPLSQMSLHFYEAVGYHGYEGNAFDGGEQQRLLDAMGDKQVMVLRNHGLLTVGESVPEAFSLMYYLEQCCRSQIDAMASGAKLLPVGHAVASEMRDQYHRLRMPFSRREWPALLRLLDRRNPGYAD